MNERIERLRKLLDDAGYTFSDCVGAFAAIEGDEKIYADHVAQAVVNNDDLATDARSVVSLGDDGGAWVSVWVWVSDKDIWKGPTDTDGEPCRTVNHYTCDECDVSWTDQWSCACNDKCPTCGAEIEPHESNELDLNGNLVP